MQSIKIAKRYAKGLFNFSLDAHELDKVYSEMQKILNLVNQNDHFLFFFTNPLLSPQKNEVILDRLFSSFSKTTLNFLKLVSLHKRTLLLKLIARIFVKMYKLKKQWIEITLITAVTLSNSIEDQILDKLFQKKTSGKKYFISKEIDPRLMGGFIVRMENKEWDMSLNTKLRRLHQNLKDMIII